jgi:hypothetical protein
MLKKLTDTLPYDLLPLLSALIIAMGMPLLHPIVHSHSENYSIIPEHRDEHIPAYADKDHKPNCPICDFLAMSQLNDTGIGRAITKIEPVGKIISIKDVFLAKTFPMQIEPRAPPVLASISITAI